MGRRFRCVELGPEEHASVQTVLDGGKCFCDQHSYSVADRRRAKRKAECSTYDPATGELAIRSDLSPAAIKFFVTKSTSVVREGQPSFVSAGSGPADLVPGSLIAVKFEAENGGRSVADQIAVLAVPGFTFVFAGNISSLDMGSGLLVLVDAQDDQSYQIHFDPRRFRQARIFIRDSSVSVAADFDGHAIRGEQITAE